MSTPAASSANIPDPNQRPLSEIERVTKVFYAPSQTFADIRRNAKWIVPFILMIVVGVIFVFSAGQKVGWETLSDNQQKLATPSQQEAMQKRLENATPEQKQSTRNLTVNITKGISYGYTAIILIFILINSAIYLAIMNFGLGAELRYGQIIAVNMYAGLIGLLKTLLAIIGLWTFIDPADFQISMPLATSPAAFISIADHPALFKFCSTGLDVFSLWITALVGLGLAVLSKKSIGTCMVVAFAVLFAWALLPAIFALF